ncbi:MAG TPA: hypothetical protein VFE18_02355 [Phenylobacterium sp.]|nr:hypothetical protein [Phenylobacterium sp.]HZZ66991.1 hypothetical protein [Phenylobacterium sp.]
MPLVEPVTTAVLDWRIIGGVLCRVAGRLFVAPLEARINRDGAARLRRRRIAAAPGDCALAVLQPGRPMVEHGLARELRVLEGALVWAVAINQLDHGHRRLPGELAEPGDLGIVSEVLRQVLDQLAERRLHPVNAQLSVGVQPRPAGIADVLLALAGVLHRAGKRTAGAEQIDLVDVQVFQLRLVEDVFQRGVGDQSAVPVPLAIDLDGRQAGRQGAGGHDVRRPDLLVLVVEVGEVAGADVDRAYAEARRPGVDPVEVDQALERGPERGRVVVAQLLGAPGQQERRYGAGREEPRHARSHGPADARITQGRTELVQGAEPARRPARAHQTPEFPQPLQAQL